MHPCVPPFNHGYSSHLIGSDQCEGKLTTVSAAHRGHRTRTRGKISCTPQLQHEPWAHRHTMLTLDAKKQEGQCDRRVERGWGVQQKAIADFPRPGLSRQAVYGNRGPKWRAVEIPPTPFERFPPASQLPLYLSSHDRKPNHCATNTRRDLCNLWKNGYLGWSPVKHAHISPEISEALARIQDSCRPRPCQKTAPVNVNRKENYPGVVYFIWAKVVSSRGA